MSRRVVVTVVDAMTAAGDGLGDTYERLLQGGHAFAPVARFDVSAARSCYAALREDDPTPAEMILSIAGRISSVGRSVDVDRAYYAGTPDAAPPERPETIRVGGVTGSAWDRVYTSGCVAASSALVDAAAAISSGRADRVLVAAARVIDAPTFHLFSSGGAMSRDEVTRPMTLARSGMLLGDGAAIIVLEAADQLSDDKVPFAELRGWGRAGDGFDSHRPDPDASGMTNAIRAALCNAAIGPDEIDLINMHGTGTQLGDAAEYRALATVFGADTIPSAHAPKASVGHLLEATGLIEAAIAVASISSGTLPPSAGVRAEDATLFGSVLTCRRYRRVTHVLSTNFAFGGSNTALLFSAWNSDSDRTVDSFEHHEPVVLGRVPPLVPAKPLQHFIASDYPSAVYDAAQRCLDAVCLTKAQREKIALLIVAEHGDQNARQAVRERLAQGGRLPPRLLVQGTPTSAAGIVACTWGLRGSITVLATSAGLDHSCVHETVTDIATADSSSAVLVIRYEQRRGSCGTGEAILFSFR